MCHKNQWIYDWWSSSSNRGGSQPLLYMFLLEIEFMECSIQIVPFYCEIHMPTSIDHLLKDDIICSMYAHHLWLGIETSFKMWHEIWVHSLCTTLWHSKIQLLDDLPHPFTRDFEGISHCHDWLPVRVVATWEIHGNRCAQHGKRKQHMDVSISTNMETSNGFQWFFNGFHRYQYLSTSNGFQWFS